MIWAIFVLMALLATATVLWPVLRKKDALTTPLIFGAVFVPVLAAGLYAYIGTPYDPDQQTEMPSVEEMVSSLAERLEDNPADVVGWKMLGRSYIQLGRIDEAITAFETASELESGRNGDTLISLGEAWLIKDRETIAGKGGQLIESGLALSPNNTQGLFYGGLVALQRGDRGLAADRWEALVAQNPPDDIRNILEPRIAEWRAEPAPPMAAIVVADVSADARALEAAGEAAQLYLIARDPARPSPPVAVTRRPVADLPTRIELSDANAMVPGRVPSAFDELEVIARISLSGQPVAQTGDWFGRVIMRPADGSAVDIEVNEQVP